MSSEGDRRKDEGMARAEAAAKRWSYRARFVIDFVLAPLLDPFTSEALTAIIGLPRGRVVVHGNGAVGAAMNAAAHRGTIKKIDRVNSKRATLHAAELTVWMGTGKEPQHVPLPPKYRRRVIRRPPTTL